MVSRARGGILGQAERIKELREAMRFEQEQLARLQAARANAELNPMQALNWPQLVLAHERAIALYAGQLKASEAD